ncbi:hypothetical protein FRB94_008425 [Tulasnella sp. JGI-2019a]|nr:hypothetical protein FRB93_007257 [Tulasnella sp. JGI-2019a]KAG8996276.1 hypothetical protein FRB94_008425 [Tulasnella sp. JGI-2019a]
MSFGTLFTSKPIRLRHISLSVCSIPWDSGLFSGLKTLELHKLVKEGPSFDQFISFLHASPGLVRISLEELELQGNTLLDHAEIVTLQSLETFEMENITCHVAEHLLTILRVPKCGKFHLINDRFPSSKLFDPSMEHLFPILRAIMASCDGTEIIFHKSGLIVVSCNGTRRMLDIKLSTGEAPQDWQTAMSERLRNLLGSTIVVPSLRLLIYMNTEGFLSTVIPLVGGDCPIEELTLLQQGPDANIPDKLGGVFELLSKPREVDGATRWPLPNPKILRIEYDTWTEHEPLINMICNRYTDRELREACERPEKLQSLQIESGGHGDGSLYSVMCDMLGPDVVRYGSRSRATHYLED